MTLVTPPPLHCWEEETEVERTEDIGPNFSHFTD